MAFIYDLTDTWNAGGTTFNAIKMNVTDTASAAASKLITVQVSGSEKFSVKKDGAGYFAGNVGIGTVSPSRALEIDVAGTSALRLTDSSTPTTYAEIISANGTLSLSADGGNAVGSSNIQFDVDASELMRLNSTGLGIGTTSPANELHLKGAGGTSARLETGNGANYTEIKQTQTSPALTFLSDGTESMRIDNATGNVGIGTSSPAALLHVAGVARVDSFINLGNNSYIRADSAGQLRFQGGSTATTFYNSSNSAELMRITQAGNVGIGTSSPFDNGSSYGDLSLNGTSGGILSFLDTDVRQGWVGSVNDEVRLSTTTASGYLTFRTAGGGSGTERMRIDSSGNVGIGTSSPDSKLDIEAANSQLRLTDSDDSKFAEFSYSSGKLVVRNNSTTTTTEQFTLDGSGRLGIGTSSPSTILTLNEPINNTDEVALRFTKSALTARYGELNFDPARTAFALGSYQTATPWPIVFDVGSERMRIDSSGNLLVGTTSNASLARVRVENSGNDGVMSQQNAAGGYCFKTNAANNSGTYYHMEFQEASVARGSITSNGSATAYNTSSDYRLKDIDGPITGSGAYIDALKPVQGSWKADGSRFIGLLAHEVQEVSETTIATGEKDGEEMQAMDYSSPEIIANLIAEIQSLRARVAQLEG